MEFINSVIGGLSNFVSSYIVPPELLILTLLGTGLFLTLRLGFIQLTRLKHGALVTTGKYDDPSTPGDVTHFQALTTALSATVGVGNIAGVAIAIHYGGPGALFWMWVTAFLGMAVKFSEVTLSLKYRKVEQGDDIKAWQGTVSGGPMYSIERGLGPKWKPLAIFFALGLMLTSFLTGNAIQANTVSDLFHSNFGISPFLTGSVTSIFVAIIIFGGIKRIGKVTSILAPVMAIVYVLGSLIILVIHVDDVLPSFLIIFREAFNPTSGVAGTGAGVFLMTMTWGIKRGLFSNEAGQGSAPIAHAAAQTDEPVSEGVVALLEPLIDTLIICTLTGLVIISTGVWNSKHPTPLDLSSGDITYISADDQQDAGSPPIPTKIQIIDGVPHYETTSGHFAWHDVVVDHFYMDPDHLSSFSGTIYPADGKALGSDGTAYQTLYGAAVETAAPLTSLAFSKDLGVFGSYIVMLCVALFAVSTAISWSYYGDRCANYVFGKSAILPFKVVYVLFHFIGATASLSVIWNFGDVALSIVTIPNLLSLWLLSPILVKETKSYFQRKPWQK